MTIDPKKLTALAVHLQGKRIGVITRLAGDRQLFAFEEAYIDDPARPTLSLSFKGELGTIVGDTKIYRVKVPPFFSNLLPEGHLRTYLAANTGVKPEREFFLLAALGSDLPGAVVVAPIADGSEVEPETVGGDPNDAAKAAEPLLRFSLAGVQLKFSAILEATGGLTIPVAGMGGSWIVKLPSQRFPSVPENEFVMLELAREVGISVPPNSLVEVADIKGLPPEAAQLQGKALAVKRFDRASDGKRIHMEDFAQVFGTFPADKYEGHSYANIAAVLRAEAGEKDTYEFFRRVVFTVLIGNGDMHLKNWSLLYPDARTPQLSPAYDFVSTIPYMPREQLGLNFGDTKSLSGITRDQVRRFADKAHLPMSPLWELVGETVQRTVEAWRHLGQRELLPDDIQAKVQQQIETAARGVER